MKFFKQLMTALAFIGVLLQPVLASTQVPIGMSTSTTLSFPVTSTDSNAELAFDIDVADAFVVEVIVPVDDATVSIVDPNGKIVLLSTDASTNRVLGSSQTPALPGSYVFFPKVKGPMAGTWKVLVDFPSPSYDTVIIGQVAVQTPIAFGMAIAANEYVLGEPVPVAALLTDRGEPISTAATQATVVEPSNSNTVLSLADDGQGIDAAQGDGIYSNTYIPNELGEYEIKGTATVNWKGSQLVREATKKVNVIPASVNIVSHKLSPVFTSEGCVSAISQYFELDVQTDGDYALHGHLTDGVNELNSSKRRLLTAGKHVVALEYSKEKIAELFSETAELSVNTPFIYSITDDAIKLATPRLRFEDIIDLSTLERCREPIEITGQLQTTPVMSEDGTFIKALSFSFPVHVTNTGTYTGSVNISSAAGENLELVSFQKYLQKGESTFEFTVSGEVFKQADGPYELNSLLLYSRSTSYRQSVLGETPPYKKENFSPPVNVTLTGNLFGLERNNWESVPAENVSQPKVGGYLRAGASIPYDFETLASFDLNKVTGDISKATLIVTFGDSTLQYPFNDVTVHTVCAVG